MVNVLLIRHTKMTSRFDVVFSWNHVYSFESFEKLAKRLRYSEFEIVAITTWLHFPFRTLPEGRAEEDSLPGALEPRPRRPSSSRERGSSPSPRRAEVGSPQATGPDYRSRACSGKQFQPKFWAAEELAGTG